MAKRPGSFHTRIPILMYHHIGAPSAKEDAPFFVSVKRFKKQMRFLYEHKFLTIKPSDLIETLKGNRQFYKKPVMITFDDGSESIYINAFPVLRSLGLNATVFLTVNYIDKKNTAGKASLIYKPLSWEQIREMERFGVSFQPHSLTHHNLAEMDPDKAYIEIKGSKDALESALGKEARLLAYPYGEYNPRVKEMVKKAGYAGAVGAWGGLNTEDTDLFELKRIPVFDRDTNLQLKMKLIFEEYQ